MPASPKAQDDLVAGILDIKKRWGDRLVVLAHHYQRPEVVAVGDVRGDSFELARQAASRAEAKHIVFCGVSFMAESAVVLARPGQRVYHPDPSAGCPLADFADAVQVERAIEAIERERGEPGSVVPVAYMNSDVEVKAMVGRRGGTICTSSNAARAFGWALGRGKALLFVPDEHLGWNTAAAIGIPEEEVTVWDPGQGYGRQIGPASLESARVVLWRGHCHVHTAFTPEHVAAARESSPGCLVVVHPECHREVVKASDGSGSTTFLVRAVAEAAEGSTVYVGTEHCLVTRLATENPGKKVVPLARSVCPNMSRITLRKVRDTLAAIPDLAPVEVEEDLSREARLALDRMLTLG